MADLAMTEAQVLPDTSGDILKAYLSAATLTAGSVVYLDTATLTWKLLDIDAGLTNIGVIGLALHAALAGQPVQVQRTGRPTLGAGAAPAVGTIYIGSDTAGGIRPAADVDSGDRLIILGVGYTGNKLAIPPAGMFDSGATTP
jgi:hypothetical protein